MPKEFTAFDSDSRVVEPPVLWEKYLDPEYRTLGKHVLWRQDGRTGRPKKKFAPRCGRRRRSPEANANNPDAGLHLSAAGDESKGPSFEL